jgi:hypothetical protein
VCEKKENGKREKGKREKQAGENRINNVYLAGENRVSSVNPWNRLRFPKIQYMLA